MTRNSWILILILGIVGASIATENSQYREDVTAVLVAAGENRVELEKVMNHYAEADDSLKLLAAEYLIANMDGHSYVIFGLYDTLGNEITFDALDYPDFATLLEAVDTLEVHNGPLDFSRKDTIPDARVITSAFLIDQIDFAFRAWREKTWARGLSFEAFCEYVLPYRGSGETLEAWRQEFWTRYQDVIERMNDAADPMEAASLINDDVRSWFKFDERFYFHPTDQGLSEMLENKMGRCEDMTNITIYALRANGLAVTSDYTPFWANSGNNHAWNAILTADGAVIPFMGAEANPGDYSLANKVAKVYRKTFGKQLQNLVFQQRKQEKIPRWLSGKNYRDVTKEYVDVSDVVIPFEEATPDSVDIAYLCVFNSGEWQAIHWGRIAEGKVVFSDMGVDVAYLPAYYLNEQIVPAGLPFVLRADGKIEYVGVNENDPSSMHLVSVNRRKQEISTDGVEASFLTAGIEYELFYWQNGWHSVGKAVAGAEPLDFENVPSGGLYWLLEDASDGEEERIFTYERGGQVWW